MKIKNTVDPHIKSQSYLNSLKEKIRYLKNEKCELEDKIEAFTSPKVSFLKIIPIQIPSEWCMKIFCAWV